MHRRGAERVVDLELEEDHAHELKDDVGADTVDDGGPGLQHVAASSDGNEAAQDAVADSEQIPCLGGEAPAEVRERVRGVGAVEPCRWHPSKAAH